jgi:hypothetical protein
VGAVQKTFSKNFQRAMSGGAKAGKTVGYKERRKEEYHGPAREGSRNSTATKSSKRRNGSRLHGG